MNCRKYCILNRFFTHFQKKYLFNDLYQKNVKKYIFSLKMEINQSLTLLWYRLVISNHSLTL